MCQEATKLLLLHKTRWLKGTSHTKKTLQRKRIHNEAHLKRAWVFKCPFQLFFLEGIKALHICHSPATKHLKESKWQHFCKAWKDEGLIFSLRQICGGSWLVTNALVKGLTIIRTANKVWGLISMTTKNDQWQVRFWGVWMPMRDCENGSASQIMMAVSLCWQKTIEKTLQ